MDLQDLRVMGNAVELRRYPKGVEYVFVNDVAVVEKDKHTGTKPRRVLKRVP